MEIEEGSEICYAGIIQVASGSFPELLDFCDRGERPIILPAQDRIATDAETIAWYETAHPLDGRGRRRSADQYEFASYYCPQGDIVIRTGSEFDERLALGDLIMPVEYFAHFEGSTWNLQLTNDTPIAYSPRFFDRLRADGVRARRRRSILSGRTSASIAGAI